MLLSPADHDPEARLLIYQQQVTVAQAREYDGDCYSYLALTQSFCFE
jgi:hypothetical protein